jgi:ferredoxin
MCTLETPDRFSQDDHEGTVIVLRDTVDVNDVNDVDTVRQTIALCPSGALRLVLTDD